MLSVDVAKSGLALLERCAARFTGDNGLTPNSSSFLRRNVAKRTEGCDPLVRR